MSPSNFIHFIINFLHVCQAPLYYKNLKIKISTKIYTQWTFQWPSVQSLAFWIIVAGCIVSHSISVVSVVFFWSIVGLEKPQKLSVAKKLPDQRFEAILKRAVDNFYLHSNEFIIWWFLQNAHNKNKKCWVLEEWNGLFTVIDCISRKFGDI